MDLGFLIVKDMRSAPFEEVASWAASKGFAFVDAGLDAVHLLRQYGLNTGAATLEANPVTTDADARRAAQGEAIAFIERAVSLGVSKAMIPHVRVPGVPFEETLRLFVEGYAPVVSRAEEHSFKLFMEPYHAHGAWMAITPETIRATLAALPSPSLGISMDPSHFVVQGIDPIRATLEFGERILHVHAKDAEILRDRLYDLGYLGQSLNNPTGRHMVGWWRYRLPGYGELDWPRFFGALAEIGYDGQVAIEHEDAIWYGSVERNQRGLLLAQAFLDPFMR